MSLPIVEEISGLPSQMSRATWLIQCPDWHFMGYAGSIRSAFEAANFPEAIAYLEARMACLTATRSTEGDIPHLKLVPLFIRQAEMREAARMRDKAATAEGGLG